MRGLFHVRDSWSFSVSEDLLCAFELLKPLDGPALRKEMTKAKRKR
jgi:serine/threonine-protein phosphatase PP1 catalytic subunit